MAKKKSKVEAPEYPKVLETFMDIGDWEFVRMRQSEPSAFNGYVRVKKYRITVEQIEEPIEVIQERLEKLWAESDNHHHRDPLRIQADSIGYEFKSAFGSERKKH